MTMAPTAMEPVSGVSLAGSLATLAGCAATSCQSLWTLQSRLKHIPSEIRSLTEDTKILQSHLIEIENFTKYDRDAHLPFELRSVWQRTEADLRADLENLQELVHQFQHEIDSPSDAYNRFFARLRYAESDDRIPRLRRAFKAHIEMLNFVDVLLTWKQVIAFQTSVTVQNSKLAQKISEGFSFHRAELRAIKKILSELQSLPTHEERGLARIRGEVSSTLTGTDLNLQTRTFQGKRRRRVVWKWSIYQFPIGTLTTEALLAEEGSQESFPKKPMRKIQLTFKFKPPVWLMNYLLQINYTIFTKGNMLPYWQRTQCGAQSLLPAELKSCLDEGDCLAAADCFSRIPLTDVLRLCESQHLNGVLIPSHLTFIKDAEGRSVVVRSCSMSLDARVGTTEPHSGDSPKIYAIYTSFSFIEPDQGSQNFVPLRASYHHPDNWLWAHVLVNDREIPKDYPFFPRIGIPVSQDGFHRFIRHIGQHLDPQGILELPRMDRWWISALIHGVPHFKAFVYNHLASFRSLNSASRFRPKILESFEYMRVVEEVISSSRPERVTFMSFLCVFGTRKMLLPFRSFGFSWYVGEQKNPFLRAAILSHNRETFEIVAEALRGTAAFKNTLDRELLDEFLGSPFCNQDDGFLNELLLHLPSSITQTENLFVYLRAQESLQCPEIPIDLLANVRPSRRATKGEVALHLIVCLHYGNSSNVDALTLAVEWGLDESLDAMLGCQDYMADPALAMLEALDLAGRNFFMIHPRAVTILESKAPQYPLIETNYLVEEGDDVLCCLLLIGALQKMRAFPEQKFANFLVTLAQRAIKLTESTTDSDVRFSAGSRGTILIAAVLGSLDKYRRPHDGVLNAETAYLYGQPSVALKLRRLLVVSILTKFREILNPCAHQFFQYTRPVTAYIRSVSERLWKMTSLDIGLMIFGTYVSLVAVIEYMLWEVAVWIYRVSKPSNAAFVAIGVTLLASACHVWVS